VNGGGSGVNASRDVHRGLAVEVAGGAAAVSVEVAAAAAATAGISKP